MSGNKGNARTDSTLDWVSIGQLLSNCEKGLRICQTDYLKIEVIANLCSRRCLYAVIAHLVFFEVCFGLYPYQFFW